MNASYWIVSAAIALTGLCVMATGDRMAAAGSEAVIEEQDFSYGTGAVSSMDVRLGKGQLVINAVPNAENVTVSVRNAPKSLKTELDEESGELRISDEERFRLVFFDLPHFTGDVSEQTAVIVTVPEDRVYEVVTLSLGAVKQSSVKGITTNYLSLDLGSGDLTVQDVCSVMDCTVNCGSGQIKVLDSEAEHFWMYQGSGSSEMGRNCFGEADLILSSGNMTCKNADVWGALRIEVSSGSFKGEDIAAGEQTELALSSGSIRIDGIDPGNAADVGISSGKAELVLAGAEEDYSFDCSTSSGSTSIGSSRGKSLTLQKGDKQFRSDVSSGSLKVDFQN